jgi:hypothetical protein
MNLALVLAVLTLLWAPLAAGSEQGESAELTAAAAESKFYMYTLPERVVNTWPADNLTLTKYSIYNASFALNKGAGPLIDAKRGMYGTWQFALFKLVYNRLQRSPRRTLDPAQASTFFVPYDGGMDATVSAWDGRRCVSLCL